MSLQLNPKAAGLGVLLAAGAAWWYFRGRYMAGAGLPSGGNTNQAAGPRLPSLPPLPVLPALPGLPALVSGAVPNVPSMPAMPPMPPMPSLPPLGVRW